MLIINLYNKLDAIFIRLKGFILKNLIPIFMRSNSTRAKNSFDIKLLINQLK